MKLDNISLPHPVLGLTANNNDSEEADVMGLFEVTETLTIGQVVEAKIDYELCNPQLNELIADGKASFACEVSCRKTAFREVFLSSSKNHKFTMPVDDLRDQIAFRYFILAISQFLYKDERGWHSDYQGQVFEIKRGMVLGYGGEAKHMLERKQAASKRGASLISVLCGEKETGPFEVDPNGEALSIFLPKKIYAAFDGLYANNPSYAVNFHASLIIPALVHVLTLMHTEGGKEEYGDKQWFQALDTQLSMDPKFRYFELTPAKSLEIAQIMIDCPFSKLTESLAKVEPEECED